MRSRMCGPSRDTAVRTRNGPLAVVDDPMREVNTANVSAGQLVAIFKSRRLFEFAVVEVKNGGSMIWTSSVIIAPPSVHTGRPNS